MKITEVRAHPLAIPLTEALFTAHEALRDSSMVLVEVRTDEGLTGYGEIKGSPLKTIAEWVSRLGEVIVGMGATRARDRLEQALQPDRAAAARDVRRRRRVSADRTFEPPARDGGDRRNRHRLVGLEGQGSARCPYTSCSAASGGRSSRMRPAATIRAMRRPRARRGKWRITSRKGYRGVKLKTGGFSARRGDRAGGAACAKRSAVSRCSCST